MEVTTSDAKGDVRPPPVPLTDRLPSPLPPPLLHPPTPLPQAISAYLLSERQQVASRIESGPLAELQAQLAAAQAEADKRAGDVRELKADKEADMVRRRGEGGPGQDNGVALAPAAQPPGCGWGLLWPCSQGIGVLEQTQQLKRRDGEQQRMLGYNSAASRHVCQCGFMQDRSLAALACALEAGMTPC
jgi:hypothetical protein